MGNIDWIPLPVIWPDSLGSWPNELLLYFPEADYGGRSGGKLPAMYRTGFLDDWRGRSRKPTHYAQLTAPAPLPVHR